MAQTTDGVTILGTDAISIVPPLTNEASDQFDELTIELGIPETYHLKQNYPNPFNPETTIHYALPEASHAVIQIYDIRGAKIKTLVDSEMHAGYQSVLWNGRDEMGRIVSGGIYLCKIQAGSYQHLIRMLLIK